MADRASQLDSPLPACLLAASGGMLDVITYLNHGHVFACAMTGNVVLMGIAALAGDWLQVTRHLVLLIAFFFGVAASLFLRSHHAALAGLALEMAALLVAGAMPSSFSPILFTAWVAFFASFQSATFRHVNQFSYNSTFLTGNLRTAAEGLYRWLYPDKQASNVPDQSRYALRQASQLGAICACFFAGALLGSWLAPRWGNRSLWAVLPLLATAMADAWFRVRNPSSTAEPANPPPKT